MLLNEFLKEHRKVQELEANDAEQQRQNFKKFHGDGKRQAAPISSVPLTGEAPHKSFSTMQ